MYTPVRLGIRDGPVPIMDPVLYAVHMTRRKECPMGITQSRLFDGVRLTLGTDDVKNHFFKDSFADIQVEVTALTSYVKNHRVNHKNLFEVVRILWPQASMSSRPVGDTDHEFLIDFAGDEDTYNQLVKAIVSFDVTFPDGSQGIIYSVNGIGEEFWLVS